MNIRLELVVRKTIGKKRKILRINRVADQKEMIDFLQFGVIDKGGRHKQDGQQGDWEEVSVATVLLRRAMDQEGRVRRPLRNRPIHVVDRQVGHCDPSRISRRENDRQAYQRRRLQGDY